MHELYAHIVCKCKEPIPYDDAVQMFLWLFCTLDILPPSMRHLVLTRSVLASTFAELARNGRIDFHCEENRLDEENLRSSEHWEELISDLLHKRIQLSQEFRARASQYL